MLLYEQLLHLALTPPTRDRLGNLIKPIRQFKKQTRLSGRQWKRLYKHARKAALAALMADTSTPVGEPKPFS